MTSKNVPDAPRRSGPGSRVASLPGAARRALSLGLALLATLVMTKEGRANGRLPASNAFAFHPSAPGTVYMRTTFGILVAKDSGHTWDWICDRSVGLNGPEDPSLGVFADGTLAATMFEGLGLTHDGACSFAFAGGAAMGQIFIDIAVRKDAFTAGVAVTSGFANKQDDAGNPLFSSLVFVTTDSGQTWTQKGAALDPSLLVQTIDWSPADPTRMYLSAVRGGTSPAGVLLVSDDAGGTWTERPFALVGKERAPFVAALDPHDKDVLYVRTNGTQVDPARLLVSKDGGKTWSVALTTTGPMQGLALSEDGTKLFAGGPSDGLFVASTADLAFTKASALQVQCLAYQKGELWACSNEFSGFTAGVSTDDGKTFAPRLHLSDVRGPLACPAGTPTHELCTADWPTQAATLGIAPGGSTTDAGGSADGGAAHPGSAGGGGGCSLRDAGSGTGAAGAGGAGLLMALSGLALLRQRSRRYARK